MTITGTMTIQCETPQEFQDTVARVTGDVTFTNVVQDEPLLRITCDVNTA
ncbi:MAG: hypothetical protein WC551_10920 [Patescibacteria group bacterium]